MDKRSYSKFDRLLIQLERGLATVCSDLQSRRPNPAVNMPEPLLTESQRRVSCEMMRVNHAGEVCAQALYLGQMTLARSPAVYETLEKAAEEETDHLAWTAERLKELNSHRSYLNVFWYTQAYAIGWMVGFAGDRWSLGFIEETERQVTQHLAGHLDRLPAADTKSRKIITQMREDEQRHGQTAAQSGARPLPRPIKRLMAAQAKIMTSLAAWF